MEEEPAVAFAGGVFALEGEGEGGGGEVDEEEGEEEGEELVEGVGGGGFRVEVLVEDVVDDAGDEHEIDEGGDEGQQDLEDEDVGQGRRGPWRGGCEMAPFVFEDGLEDAEGPAEALAHEAVGVDGGLGEGEGAGLRR